MYTHSINSFPCHFVSFYDFCVSKYSFCVSIFFFRIVKKNVALRRVLLFCRFGPIFYCNYSVKCSLKTNYDTLPYLPAGTSVAALTIFINHYINKCLIISKN